MSVGTSDEEAARQSPSDNDGREHGVRPTPLPKLQLGVLLVVQMAEPITAWAIWPFIADVIRASGVTGGDDNKVGYYAGILTSAFFVTEVCCMFAWGRLSDRIGRRPVLLFGLSGLIAAMLSFGLAQSFTGLLFARVLQGMTNGNVGVMKSMMGELTDETNMAKAFSILPAVWCLGMSLGPFMGGFLAHPAERYPNIFGGDFWKAHPFFLPCFAAAACAFISWLLAFFFLEETLPAKARKRTPDPKTFVAPIDPNHQEPLETTPLLPSKAAEPPSIRELLTRPVLIATLNYGFLALVDICMFAILPIFFAAGVAPPSHPGPGGLGLSPPVIGTFFGLYGLVNGIFQLLCFASLHGRFGTKRLYVGAMTCFLPICFALPALDRMIRATNGVVTPAILASLGVTLAFMISGDLCYSSIFIAIRRAAPSASALGAVNGLAQSMGSAMRAIGPALISSLFSFSLETNGWWVYYALFAIVLGGILAGRQLPDQ